MIVVRCSKNLFRNYNTLCHIRYVGTTQKVKVSKSQPQKGGGGSMPEVMGDVKKYENLNTPEVHRQRPNMSKSIQLS